MDLRWRLFGYVRVSPWRCWPAAGLGGVGLHDDVAGGDGASTTVNTVLAVQAAQPPGCGVGGAACGWSVTARLLSVERSIWSKCNSPDQRSHGSPAGCLMDSRQIHERRIPLADGTLVIGRMREPDPRGVARREALSHHGGAAGLHHGNGRRGWLALSCPQPVRDLEQGLADRPRRRDQMPSFQLKGIRRDCGSHRASFRKSWPKPVRARQQLARQLLGY